MRLPGASALLLAGACIGPDPRFSPDPQEQEDRQETIGGETNTTGIADVQAHGMDGSGEASGGSAGTETTENSSTESSTSPGLTSSTTISTGGTLDSTSGGTETLIAGTETSSATQGETDTEADTEAETATGSETDSTSTTGSTSSTESESTTADAGLETSSDSSDESSSDTCPCETACNWWHDDWRHRICLRLDNTGTSETLVDFPLLVRLDPPLVDHAQFAAGGHDLRVVDSKVSAVLAHEIDVWSAGQSAIIWVRVPSIQARSTHDSICVYFGNPSASDGQDVNGTFPEPHRGVWHMSADLGDATQHGHQLVDFGSTDTAGALGPARAVAGADGHLNGSPSLALQILGDLTLSMWVRVDGSTPGGSVRMLAGMGAQGNTDPNNYPWWLSLDDGTTLRAFWESGAGLDVNLKSTITVPALAGQWHAFAMTRDTSTMRLRFFFDGSQLGSAIAFTSLPTDASDTFPVFGQDTYPEYPYFLEGALDEVRVEATPRSPAWMRARYLAETDQFVTYASQEDLDAATNNAPSARD